MHLVLICPIDESLIYGGRHQFDRDEALEMLRRLRATGRTFEVIDSDQMPESEQRLLYTAWETQAVMTRNAKNYRARNVFGSNSRGGGYLFGKQIPALGVFSQSRHRELFPAETRSDFDHINQRPFARDLYPHKLRRGGEVIIRLFLESLLREG